MFYLFVNLLFAFLLLLRRRRRLLLYSVQLRCSSFRSPSFTNERTQHIHYCDICIVYISDQQFKSQFIFRVGSVYLSAFQPYRSVADRNGIVMRLKVDDISSLFNEHDSTIFERKNSNSFHKLLQKYLSFACKIVWLFVLPVVFLTFINSSCFSLIY